VQETIVLHDVVTVEHADEMALLHYWKLVEPIVGQEPYRLPKIVGRCDRAQSRDRCHDPAHRRRIPVLLTQMPQIVQGHETEERTL
jgi:hypothetical protein